MRPRLEMVLKEIDFLAGRVAVEGAHRLYVKRGGVIDPRIDHDKLIAELGVGNAAALAKRFIELQAAAHRLYGLNPARLMEHLRLMQAGYRRGWFRRIRADDSPGRSLEG